MRKIYISFAATLLCCIGVVNKSIAQYQLWGMTSDGGSKNGGGNIFSINTDGSNFKEQYAFLGEGHDPYGQHLISYGDGFLYGVVGFGGTDNGIFYRVWPDGSNYQVLYNFQKATGDYPYSGLINGQDGYLYGTTSQGGANGNGAIYRIKNDGTGYTPLHYFTGTDGSFPGCNLTQSGIGKDLYGATQNGGANGQGTVFTIKTDGTGFKVLHNFNGVEGSSPDGLIFTTVGGTNYLYGVSGSGGKTKDGLIFRMAPDGSLFQVQYYFSSYTGSIPSGPLLDITTGILYGTTQFGGANNAGVVYAFNTITSSYQVLHNFPLDPNNLYERRPTGPLIYVNGALYGTTQIGGSYYDGILYKINPDGSGYQVIHPLNDENGFGNLMLYNKQIYGLTAGEQVPSGHSDGTIYKLNLDGTGFQTIHSFNNPNGYGPSGSLTLAQDGSLYGMTTYGGSGYSNGIIFSIKKDGTGYTPLQWLGNGIAEGNPLGSLIQANNGSFYGMNTNGGSSATGDIFKFTAGTPPNYQVFTPFCWAPGCAAIPFGSLIQASDGKLYGMTSQSGQTNYGAIFTINPDGTGYTNLHLFAASDGATPHGSLIQAPDGFLYGMTAEGGSAGFGVVFRMRTDGSSFQTLLDFGQSIFGLFGIRPMGALLLAGDGKLYGMASEGGSHAAGVIFRINTDGLAFQVIYNFDQTNGFAPVGSLVQDKSTGFLYGMTIFGGAYNFGTVFKIQTDGTAFQKLLDFNGPNGKFPKGDLLLVPVGGTSPNATGQNAAVAQGATLTRNSTAFSISPNPVKNSFNISLQVPETGKVCLYLLDAQGRTVKQLITEKSTGVLWHQWDVSRLPAGVYLLKLIIQNKQFVKTIVKQ